MRCGEGQCGFALPGLLAAVTVMLLGLALAGAGMAAAEVPLGKLPDAVQPQAYRLDLTVDPDKERFSGKVEVDARLNAPSTVVYLHGRKLAMRSAAANVAGQRQQGIWKQEDPTGVASLTFASPLPAGPVTFAFEYDAAFNENPAGMFRVKVDDAWYSWTQFQSIDARATRGGVPVFSRPCGSFSSFKRADNDTAGGSPARPAA